MKIFLIRHALSEGNVNHIIQGNEYDYGISQQGKNNLNSVKENLKDKGISFILHSPSARTLETAEYISKSLNIPKQSVSELREFDSGVLAGLTHEQAKKDFPKYYDEWIKRGDLDFIPGAEKGDNLQARSIYIAKILQQYKDETILIISHAGFMRSLINLLSSKARISPINVEHEYIHELNIDLDEHEEIIKNLPNKSLSKVKTHEKTYVIKTRKSTESLPDVLYYKLSEVGLIPRLCFLKLEHNNFTSVSIWEDGYHLHGKLEYSNLIRLIKAVATLFNIINENNYSNIRKFSDIVNCTLSKNLSYSEVLKICLNKLPVENKIIHYDLHRDNILFQKDLIKILDVDSLTMGSKLLQIGSFIVSSFLIEDYDESIIDNVLYIWNSDYSKEDLIPAIIAKAILSYNYFEKNKDAQNREHYLQKYNSVIKHFIGSIT